MKAWRFYSLGEMRLEEVPYPTPPPGWATVRMRIVQISITEASLAQGVAVKGAEAMAKLQKTISEQAPVQLFGHELCAEVVELGAGVTNVKVGDRVTSRASVPCHQCADCRAGRIERCGKGPKIGRDTPGNLAEYGVIPAEALVVLPDSVSDNEGAFMQPLGGAVAKVADADIEMGESVVVLGQGVMGLNVMQVARISGAGLVIGVDVKKANLLLSKQLGSDHQVDASEADPVQVVRELTGGLGADVVFECAGGSVAQGLAGSKTLDQALQIVADAGKVIQVANMGGTLQLNPAQMKKKNVRYIFPKLSNPNRMRHAVRLVARGQVNLKPLITHVLQGIESMPQAMEITANKAKYNAMGPAQVIISQ